MRAAVLASVARWAGLVTVTVLWCITLAWLSWKLIGD
jgi:hypothetical protein